MQKSPTEKDNFSFFVSSSSIYGCQMATFFKKLHFRQKKPTLLLCSFKKRNIVLRQQLLVFFFKSVSLIASSSLFKFCSISSRKKLQLFLSWQFFGFSVLGFAAVVRLFFSFDYQQHLFPLMITFLSVMWCFEKISCEQLLRDGWYADPDL